MLVHVITRPNECWIVEMHIHMRKKQIASELWR